MIFRFFIGFFLILGEFVDGGITYYGDRKLRSEPSSSMRTWTRLYSPESDVTISIGAGGSRRKVTSANQRLSPSIDLFREALATFIESIQIQLKATPDAIPKALAKGINTGGSQLQMRVRTA